MKQAATDLFKRMPSHVQALRKAAHKKLRDKKRGEFFSKLLAPP